VRAAADSGERALLLGIPVRRLSTVTWVLAAGLSGVASMLSAPILGPNLGGVSGPESLLAPLAAAVIGRMESLPVTLVAGIGIGIFQQAVFWNYPRSSTVDLALFLLITAALLLQRRRLSRVDDRGLGGFVAIKEVRPTPAVLARLPEVRALRSLAWAALAILVVVVPLFLNDSKLTLIAYIAIYGILAMSLLVLTGWSGQISLGQFAFAGVGAATTSSLLVHAGADMFLALVAGALVGAVVAAIVGIPAVRITGLFLAVETLAFGVPVNTFFLNAAYFPTLTPAQVFRPVILNRIDLAGPLAFYYFCLTTLAVVVLLTRNYRRTRTGRAGLSVRDNERGAAAFAVAPVRAKLVAFAFSGALAALAGGLYVIGLQGMPFSGFNPETSLVIFTIVVIGGLGSMTGPILGAVYVEGVEYFLHGAAQLLATGAGLLLLLMFLPGGLGEVFFGVRDRLLRIIASRRALSVPSLAERPDYGESVSEDAEPGAVEILADEATSTAPHSSPPRTEPERSLVACDAVDAAYGQIQVLFGVSMAVDAGEMVALLGTNGAGKSTVLRVIAGLMTPVRGRVWFDGTDITRLGPIERVKLGLVTVPGGRGVFGSLTVEENLRLAGWLTKKDRDFIAQARRRIFELFPVLAERSLTPAASLSGGEQQMLTIAQALLCRPRLLMIDELSLGLAPALVATLLGVVRQINDSGTTVVVVEQSVNVATDLARRAVFMEKGQVRFTGPTADLAGRTDLLRSVFLRSAAPAEPRRAASEVVAGIRRLEVTNMSRSFGGVTAVSGVDFSVAEGEVLGIIGSNGAGKTTLFDLCSGFLAADRGRITLDGADVTGLPAWARAERGLGRVFQDARLFPSMTVAETVAVACERHVEVREPIASVFHVGAVAESEQIVRERVDDLIATMGLDRYRDAFISELSTGTRRIVELACAMAHQPRVLLLDEPSSGIAQRESEALGSVLLDLKDRTGASLVVIEHDIPLVSSIADWLICLHLGQVLTAGKPADVLEDPRVVASYLGSDEVSIARSGVRPPAKRPARKSAKKPPAQATGARAGAAAKKPAPKAIKGAARKTPGKFS
jgi:ABC-type branched-subunit amino acid transport system ATPase component/ABC-type branched-subunit amino acid transport system permease subunit